jgi:chromosome segregation ATPase
MITDRWKKFAILVPLPPYLALAAMLLVGALAVTYYRWKSQIRRAAQAELLNGQQAAEIAALRRGSAQAEDRAVEAEGRAQQLGEELEKLTVDSRQLTGKLEKLQTEAKAEKARIAALPADQLGPELQKTIATAGILRFAQDDSEGARRVLEIIGERDSCREELGLKDQQLQICRESMIDYAAIGEQQAKQIGDLKQALDLSKRAFDKRDDLAKVQVKAAKGSWFSRFTGKAKWFVIGVGAGAVAGAAVAR